MAEHDGAMDVERLQGLAHQAGLRRRAEAKAPRPLAMPVSRPVDGDHAVALAGFAHQAAQHEIFDHAAQPVQQHERRPIAFVEVVQGDAVDSDEASERRVRALGARGAALDVSGGSGKRKRGAADANEIAIHARGQATSAPGE